jgi:FKBP-type peptidyl-prolyl cis-trans isomerase FkpA
MRLRRLAVALVLPLAFTACLEGTDYSTNVTPAIPIEQTTFAPTLNVDLAASTKTASGLYIRDITAGTGSAATGASTVSVYYAGYLSNGQLFDSRSSPSNPLPVTLGTNSVIKGWEEGLIGMKVGGTRQLIIPPSLAYGPAGYNAIPPNAVLVFTVQLVAVQGPTQ